MMTKIKKVISTDNMRLTLILLGVSFSIFLIGLIWSVFYFILVGAVCVVSNLFNAIYTIFSHSSGDDVQYHVGCGCVSIIVVITIFALNYTGKRYITNNGRKQHIYEDCPTIRRSLKIKKVRELEGFFNLCFTDCKICKERKKIENAEKMRLRKQQMEELDEDKESLYEEEYEDAPPAGVPSRYW